MSCLNNIVTVRDLCNPTKDIPLSGYDIMDAPEISTYKVSASLDEEFTKARAFMLSVLGNAITEVKNDFLGAISANGYSANLSQHTYETCTFTNTQLATASNERGFTWYKAKYNPNGLNTGLIEKIYINSAEEKSEVEIKIFDGTKLTRLKVRVRLGVNEFPVNYKVKSKSARIVIDGDALLVRSTPLTCYVGCNNTTPNACGYTKAFNGGEVAIKEGYGLGISFSCICDYEKLLCDLAKSYTGKLIYLKTRILLLEHLEHSDRFNNVVVFGKDEAKAKRIELINEFNASWNVLIQALPNEMKKYCGECIQCNGISIKTNV